MKYPIELAEWQALVEHQHHLSQQHMRDWFTHEDERSSCFSLQASGIFLDYSRNRIQPETLALLRQLAEAVGLTQKIEALFAGDIVNPTENRPALHTALRDQNHTACLVKGTDIAPLIQQAQEKMRQLVAAIHSQTWKGVTGKPIKHIVNIGIGGSYHGPQLGVLALKEFAVTPLHFHFISTVDKAHLNDVLEQVDPETALFIISSKSFTTIETLTNAQTIVTEMKQKWGEAVMKHHFVAVTANPQKAIQFGIPEEHILPLWEWVGGRYSVWSAIGLPLMLMIGEQHFVDFLAGAHEMDQHFRQADLSENMPVLLALLGVWYTNFFGATAHAIVPYAYRLRWLVPYLQQVDMESNGKRINLQGDAIHYTTGPVIVGEEGCNGQHTYHQLLHQGQHLIPVDFILVSQTTSQDNSDTHQSILLASALSQAQALMQGKESVQFAHQSIPGNRPSNILFLDRITPKTLGALLALYEHKIFVQGVIWNINSFDQWGVELGKQLLPDILHQIKKQQGQR
ncbi:MAG: glucose-6-phosphate isomerase [Gammaproteobacteria bacterium]|nr:MAG: glucose-6-phosphate isomerase [Gammaproteobacteria bacterium]